MSVQDEALGPCLDGAVDLDKVDGENVLIGEGSFAYVVEATYFEAAYRSEKCDIIIGLGNMQVDYCLIHVQQMLCIS